MRNLALHSVFGVLLLSCDRPELPMWGDDSLYADLWPTSRMSSRWLVLKCTFSDDRQTRSLPQGLHPAIGSLDDYIEQMLSLRGGAAGNLTQYFAEVSYTGLIFTTEIHGWYDAPFTSSNTLNRGERVRLCAEAVPNSVGLDFGNYDGILMVTNLNQDGGAEATGKVPVNIKGQTYNLGLVVFDSLSLYTAFAAHELGHGMGLPHSFLASTATAPAVEYGDPSDIMSALKTYQFSIPSFPGKGLGQNNPGAGPGLGAPNLLWLGLLPPTKVVTHPIGAPVAEYTISALTRSASPHPLALTIADPQSGGRLFTVELRMPEGWDAGFPAPAVYIHDYLPAASQWSFLRAGPRAPGWQKLEQLVLPGTKVVVTVLDIDTTAGTAKVRVSSL